MFEHLCDYIKTELSEIDRKVAETTATIIGRQMEQ